jgi:hypothetical protein
MHVYSEVPVYPHILSKLKETFAVASRQYMPRTPQGIEVTSLERYT